MVNPEALNFLQGAVQFALMMAAYNYGIGRTQLRSARALGKLDELTSAVGELQKVANMQAANFRLAMDEVLSNADRLMNGSLAERVQARSNLEYWIKAKNDAHAAAKK